MTERLRYLLAEGSQEDTVDDDRPPSPGWMWRPGASPQDAPLQLVVALVVVLVLVGAVVLALIAS